MREGIAFTAFTGRGRTLAAQLAAALGGELREEGTSLDAWTEESFRTHEALVFVGAAGIAVRAAAPHLQSKALDPAVVAVDEAGRWAIPLLSGHLGGANELARRIAAVTGGEAVITTATDLRGLFAVDLWAKKQGMTVLQPERIKTVSAKLLRGGEIMIDCPRPVSGLPPERVSAGEAGDVRVSYRPEGSGALQLVPRVLSLGVGCRRGVSAGTLEAAFADFCRERRICPEAVEQAATIALKRDEEGLLAFCAARGWPLRFYETGRLQAAEGAFTPSAFVERTVGVDNVCERAAVLASEGVLIEKKYARSGVSFALAERAREYDWSF